MILSKITIFFICINEFKTSVKKSKTILFIGQLDRKKKHLAACTLKHEILACQFKVNQGDK